MNKQEKTIKHKKKSKIMKQIKKTRTHDKKREKTMKNNEKQ